MTQLFKKFVETVASAFEEVAPNFERFPIGCVSKSYVGHHEELEEVEEGLLGFNFNTVVRGAHRHDIAVAFKVWTDRDVRCRGLSHAVSLPQVLI